MRRLLLFLLLLSTYSVLKGQENTIRSSDAAYDHFNLKKSHALLESILTMDSVMNEQKCRVLRRLAHQDWKYYQNYALAKGRLLKADLIGHEKHATWMLISRIERESQHFNEALYAAKKAKEFAQSTNEINMANTEYARVVYAFSEDQLEKGLAINTNLLTKASIFLTTTLAENVGMPAPSKLLLGIALLNDDGMNVLKAWQSYFQIQDIQRVYPYLSNAAEKLNRVCKNWNRAQLATSEQAVLIDALAISRFYEFIPSYVNKNKQGSRYAQEIKDIITYSRYLKKIEIETNEYYRLIAIGQENETTYTTWLSNTRESLWSALSFTVMKAYSESSFLNETEKRFGARGFTGSTGNYSGYVLCLGHMVNQEKAKVKQYGYKPEFTYTQIDMMVSNGFSSWFWEDKAIGGWATDNEIIRVREVYLNGPIAAWQIITDTVERQKIEETIRKFLNNPSTNQLVLAEGLAAKLKFDALSDLYDSLVAIGFSGQDLKLAFLSSYEQYRTAASVLAHEGRHSIERKYMPEAFEGWSNEEREFRAKLSQIIFAPEPRLELAGMVTDVTGDAGHFKANKRIVDIAIAWIKNNHSTIPKYSANQSGFSQIHLLTTSQIKRCYKQADPLNK